jgi:hypothetical protein
MDLNYLKIYNRAFSTNELFQIPDNPVIRISKFLFPESNPNTYLPNQDPSELTYTILKNWYSMSIDYGSIKYSNINMDFIQKPYFELSMTFKPHSDNMNNPYVGGSNGCLFHMKSVDGYDGYDLKLYNKNSEIFFKFNGVTVELGDIDCGSYIYKNWSKTDSLINISISWEFDKICECRINCLKFDYDPNNIDNSVIRSERLVFDGSIAYDANILNEIDVPVNYNLTIGSNSDGNEYVVSDVYLLSFFLFDRILTPYERENLLKFSKMI